MVHPIPVTFEKHTPINVEKPFKYVQHVTVPDVKKLGSDIQTSVSSTGGAVRNEGLADLSAGYSTTTASKAAATFG